MSLLLSVPYNDKEEAKQLGARWNPELKKWYVEDRENYHKFSKWIFSEQEAGVIVCGHYYLVVGEHTCFRCREQTEVIAYGIDEYMEFADPSVYSIDGDNFTFASGEVSICSLLEPIAPEVLAFIKEQYGVFTSYSKQADTTYLANHCSNCNVIQGHFYLFGEAESPFFVDSIEKARALKLLKLTVPYDFLAWVDTSCGSLDYLIKQEAKVTELKIS